MALRSRFTFVLNHLAEFAQPARPRRDEMAAYSSSSSAPPPSWVILGSIPRVSSADLPRGADHALSLAPPPRVTLLTIARRLFPDGAVTSGNFPSVKAVEPSAGLLLLHADQGRAKGPITINRPDRQSFFWADTVPGYFVLDASSAAAARALPEPELVMHQGNIGILASPAGDGHYMVAELQPVLGSEEAKLLYFSSRTGEWEFKDVRYPLPYRFKAPNGVVAHGGKLWWVDLSIGLCSCDPFADAPVLAFVPFPPGTLLQCREAWGVLDRWRAVGVSAGELRLVDMYKNNRGGIGGAPMVTVWTLDDPVARKWRREHEASFADVWKHPSYKAAGLPEKMPVLAVVHPQRPYVVYFFLEEYLFGVDLRDGSVVECEEYELVAPPREPLAARFVHAWELPRALE
ncbi:hypothetical protein EJB05_33526, partial [Eragrostis curvula]